MATTLAKLVGQIQNHLSGGLRGQGAYTYSLEQIRDEVIQKRGEVLRYLEKQGTPATWVSAAQTIEGLEVRPKDWIQPSDNASRLLEGLPVPAERLSWHHCRIPKLLDLQEPPVVYFGPAGRPQSWSVVREPGELENSAWRRLARATPLCYAEGNDMWVTQQDGRVPALLRMIAVFEDPTEAFRMGLTKQEHKLVDSLDVDQTDELVGNEPGFCMDNEVAEKVRLRVINLFLGTHGTRPINPNNGTATI